jgi:hypothetical protein
VHRYDLPANRELHAPHGPLSKNVAESLEGLPPARPEQAGVSPLLDEVAAATERYARAQEERRQALEELRAKVRIARDEASASRPSPRRRSLARVRASALRGPVSGSPGDHEGSASPGRDAASATPHRRRPDVCSGSGSRSSFGYREGVEVRRHRHAHSTGTAEPQGLTRLPLQQDLERQARGQPLRSRERA